MWCFCCFKCPQILSSSTGLSSLIIQLGSLTLLPDSVMPPPPGHQYLGWSWSFPSSFYCRSYRSYVSSSRLKDRWMECSSLHPALPPSQPRHHNKQPCKKHLHLWTVYKFTDIDLWRLAGPDIRLFRGISFSSLPLFLKDILSVNVTVHILNIATLQERRERQLGAQPMTRGQEPRRDLCQGWGWWRKLFLVGSETGCHSRRRPLRGRLGSEGHVGRSRERTNWIWNCVDLTAS